MTERAIDHRADIFALGLLLNEMFTGVVPHGEEIVTMNSIASIAPDFAYLDDLVARMIRPDRSHALLDRRSEKTADRVGK